jgi:hypothetical protein
MTQCKSRRKWKPKWIGKRFSPRKYEHHHELHTYEEALVLRVIAERGGYGDPPQWCRDEPERWNRKQLDMTFERLRRKGLVTFHGRRISRNRFEVRVHRISRNRFEVRVHYDYRLLRVGAREDA